MAEGQTAPKSSQTGPDPLIGLVINDRFRIVSMIARGGMGKVYRAEQAPLGREVALKILNPNYSGDNDPEFHKRFFLEASTCSKLTHPNTVTIFDYGRADEIYYIAMELLEGLTLHRLLRQEGPLAPARAMHVTRQICRSLREAHGLGIVHRDLKPANVFLMKHGDEHDFVKVLDFGLVKDLDNSEDITQTGLFMGSPKYMSPEQIRGERVDARADVYALGVITYEMLAGKVPFDRPNSVNILMAHVHEAPPPLRATHPECAASEALEAIVMRALAKDPNDRFEGMDAFLVALKQLAMDAGLSVTRSTELRSSGELGVTGQYGASPASVPPSRLASEPAPPLGQVLDPVELEQARPSTGRAAIPIVMAMLGALALGAAGLVAFLSGPSESAEPPPEVAEVEPTDRPEATPEPAPPVEPTPEPAMLTTLVALHSEPPGATVQVGDQEYGPTPTDVEWTGEQAERGRRVTFVFQLDGHRDYSVTRVVTGDRLDVEAELVEIRRAIRTRPPRPRPPPRNDSVRPVNGYKLDPY